MMITSNLFVNTNLDEERKEMKTSHFEENEQHYSNYYSNLNENNNLHKTMKKDESKNEENFKDETQNDERQLNEAKINKLEAEIELLREENKRLSEENKRLSDFQTSLFLLFFHPPHPIHIFPIVFGSKKNLEISFAQRLPCGLCLCRVEICRLSCISPY